MKTYKQRGGKHIGTENDSPGLNRWIYETLKNQRGEVGYRNEYNVYRPTVRANEDTPTTFEELTREQTHAGDSKRRQDQTMVQVRSVINQNMYICVVDLSIC